MDFLKLILATFTGATVALGGAALIFWSLSSYLGKLWFEKYKNGLDLDKNNAERYNAKQFKS